MQHLAIMKKSWGLTKKILSGEKKIESRWYMTKRSPWNKIHPCETVYFKDSGAQITVKAEVDKILQFENLSPEKVKNLLDQYGSGDGIGIDAIPNFVDLVKNKKYCILIFLKNPKELESFDIDKTGFGMMSAWICFDDIEKIMIKQ